VGIGEHGAVRPLIRRGQELLKGAAMVGDRDDHRSWKTRRDRWAYDTAEALTAMTSAGVRQSFERAVRGRTAEGDVAADLTVELDGLRQGLAVLVGLSDKAHE
jgi:hypothetical protein